MKKDILCAAAVFCAALIFTGAALMPGKALLPADTTQFDKPWSAAANPGATFHNTLISDSIVQSYPWRVHTMRLLRRGVVPLWNPYQFAGTPHSANNQSAVFYPPALAVFSFFGPVRGMAANALLHLWLAGFGMFLFMRANRFGRAGSLFSGLAFMSCGWFVSWLSRPEFIQTAAWLPWLFAFLAISCRARKPAFAALGGVVLGTQLLGGHAQMAIYCVLALGCYALFISWTGFFRRKRENVAAPQLLSAVAAPLLVFTAILISGLAVGAVQLLPAAELFRLAPRISDALDSTASQISTAARVSKYMSFLMPDFFGSPIHKNERNPACNYVEMCAYCGVVTLFLAGFAIALRRRAFEAFFLALAALSFLAAAGTPVLTLLLRVAPVMSVFTVTRLILISCFCVAVLAGSGLDWIVAQQQQKLRIANWTWRLFQLIALFAAAMIIMNLKIRPEVFPGGFWKCELIPVSKFAILLFLSAVFLSTGARYGARWTAALCFLLLFADTYTWGSSFNTVADSSLVYPKSRLVDYLKADKSEPFRFHAFSRGHILIMDSATALGLEDVRGYDSIYYEKYRDILRAYEDRARPGVFVQGSWVSFITYNPALLKILNIKYIMAEFDIPSYRPDLEPVGIIEGVYLYKYKDRLPRAFFVRQFVIEKNGPRALSIMTAGNFDPKKLVVLADKPELRGAISQQRPDQSRRPPAQAVKTTSSPSGEITIQATTPSPAILFISEIDYPGWVMLIDGKPTPYIRANYIFRAVALNPGSHTIQFLYRPASARAGLAIGLSALTLLAATLIFNVKKTGIQRQ